MSFSRLLTIDEVREYTSDYTPNNYLIDGEEFTDTFISLCMTLGVDAYNNMAPYTIQFNPSTFPSKAILLWGTLWQMYLGKALLLARNTMQYSDGGLQIPIEERAELYRGFAATFEGQFKQAAQALKNQQNMESGWGSISSDEAMFPSY